jgi:hypothetical protein
LYVFSKKYSLKNLHIEFIYKVWLRPRSWFGTLDHWRFARKSEMQHLIDFRKFVLGQGILIGLQVYLEEVDKIYDDKGVCERTAENLGVARIDVAFVPIVAESGKTYDRGRHTWKGSKQDPVPGAEVDSSSYFAPGNIPPK